MWVCQSDTLLSIVVHPDILVVCAPMEGGTDGVWQAVWEPRGNCARLCDGAVFVFMF
jgi:hypothetical protein